MENTFQNQHIRSTLDKYHHRYNNLEFIHNDPISIPHRFSKLQDIEIMAFWTAMLSWGQRVTIINNCNKLSELMDGAPHDFVLGYHEQDLERFSDFKHRTFNYTDTLYFLRFFRNYYNHHHSLEEAFLPKNGTAYEAESALCQFQELFFKLEGAPRRTQKHVATPMRNSTCKRLNMLLRWMVRKDESGVDFGIWNRIKPSQLLCPLDVHVDRVARRLGLIQRKQTDWKTVLELTENLRTFDADDPVKYDYALFGLGIHQKQHIE